MNNVGPCSASYLQTLNLKPLESMDLLVSLKLGTGLSAPVNQGVIAQSGTPNKGCGYKQQAALTRRFVCLGQRGILRDKC